MYKIVTFVPLSGKEIVKEALFAAGAGKIGNYDYCCFETLGVGQFRPLIGSNPAIGSHNEVERVEEVRLELVYKGDEIDKVIRSLKQAHPYETPAIDVIKLYNEE